MYIRDEEIHKVYFPNPKALLPVLKRDGSLEYMPWGRREKQSGALPLGGWARLESLKKGMWNKYFPKHCKIIVNEFMERDKATGQTNWFTVTKGHYIHGIIAQDNGEIRLYVVTIAAQDTDIHDRYPRIIANTI
ncbi:hypothetical protein IB691_06290 [Fangia hongkongensis]|nr:hypothetical protein [Fangia hongkongensis]